MAKIKSGNIFLALVITFAIIITFLGRNYFNFNPLFIALFSLITFILPGYFLNACIEKNNPLKINMLFSIIYSFIFNLLTALFALIFKLNIYELGILYILLILIILGFLFFKNKNSNLNISFDWKKISFNPLLGLVILVGIIIVYDVLVNGSNTTGDAFFHLSIIRKAIEGQDLSAINLSYNGSQNLHPAYAFPIWHIFIALLAHFTNSNIFNTYLSLAPALTIIVLIVWYQFFMKILPTKFSVFLTLLLFICFTYSFRFGYLFTRLPIPDTFGQYVLLPLALTLGMSLVFDPKIEIKKFVSLALLLLFMLLIHASQFIYYLIIMVFFSIVFIFANLNQPDFKQKLVRIGLCFGGGLVFLIPALLLLEFKSRLVSQTLAAFWQTNPDNYLLGYAPFAGIEPLAKYAYLLTPLLLLFIKKNRPLTFVLAVLLIVPVAYSETLYYIKWFLMKTVGFITLNRLYSNVTFDYVIWGLFLSVLISNLEILINKFKSAKIIVSLTAIFTIIAIYVQYKFNFILKFYESSLIALKTLNFLNNFYPLILLLILAITILIIVWKDISSEKSLEIKEPKNMILTTSLGFLVFFFFFSPSFQYLFKERQIDKFFLIGKNYTKNIDLSNRIINIYDIGGNEAIDFIKKNIPAKKVFATDQISAATFSLTFDQFFPDLPRTEKEKEMFSALGEDFPNKRRDEIITKLEADYLFLSIPQIHGGQYFDTKTERYKLIYRTDIAIYKIIK